MVRRWLEGGGKVVARCLLTSRVLGVKLGPFGASFWHQKCGLGVKLVSFFGVDVGVDVGVDNWTWDTLFDWFRINLGLI